MVELNREFLVKRYGKDNLINRTVIDIWINRIKKIDPNTFKGLVKLEKLDLSNNEIEEIDFRLFESLSNLKSLWLFNNKLKRIDPNTFKGHDKLEILSLYNNQIEEIDSRLFESLSNLKVLWLNNNKLKEIDRKCFEPLKSIEVIHLYENVGLNALSFEKQSTSSKSKLSYIKNTLKNVFIIKNYESISDWNIFLQQFPQLGKLTLFFVLFKSRDVKR